MSMSVLMAELKFANVFSDHMVLQQQKELKVWGQAKPGEEVTLTLSSTTSKAKANAEGKWQATLPAQKASFDSHKLTAKTSSESVTLDDILIGEVWLATGQSNMVWPLKKSKRAKEELPKANHQHIRLLLLPELVAAEPQDSISKIRNQWQVCTPKTAANISAVGYYVAREIVQKGKVPVGIIQCARGGTTVQTWTSKKALSSYSLGQAELKKAEAEAKAFDQKAAQAKYKNNIKRWREKVDEIKKANAKLGPNEKPAKLPAKPRKGLSPNMDRNYPANQFNAMLYPLIPMTVRGALWYQGEANARRNPNHNDYFKLLTEMVKDWRGRWGDNFPFYIVQLPNFKSKTSKIELKADRQDVQWGQFLAAQSLKHSGITIINDLGEAKNNHPINKRDVALRLARLPLTAPPFNHKRVKTGPLFKKMEIEGSKARIHFDHAGSGLATRDGKEPDSFIIKGEKGDWVRANAKIDGNTVIVSHPEIKKPVAVRYAWAPNPKNPNLMNKEKLQASVFKTDP